MPIRFTQRSASECVFLRDSYRMFNKFKTLLSNNPPAVKKAPQNPNFITDREKIGYLLGELAHQRIVLHICLDEETDEENPESMIATYLYRAGTERIALEKLDNPDDDAKLREVRKFKVIAYLYDSVLTFDTEIVAFQQEGGAEYYIAGLPDKIYRPKDGQPRQTKISTFRKVHVFLPFLAIHRTLPALIENLSTRGAGLLLSVEDLSVELPFVRKGDEFKLCQLGLESRPPKFDMIVNRVKPVGDRAVRLDCTFKSLSPETEQAVNRLIDEALRHRVTAGSKRCR